MVRVKQVILLPVLLFLLPLPIAGYAEIGAGGFLDGAEPFLEVINLVIGMLTIAIAVSMLPKLTNLGKSIKNSIFFFIISVAFFMIFELSHALDFFRIFTWHGMTDILEMFFVAFLLVAVYNFKNFLLEIGNLRKTVTEEKSPGNKKKNERKKP